MKWLQLIKTKPFWAIIAVVLTSFGLGNAVPVLPLIEAVTIEIVAIGEADNADSSDDEGHSGPVGSLTEE